MTCWTVRSEMSNPSARSAAATSTAAASLSTPFPNSAATFVMRAGVTTRRRRIVAGLRWTSASVTERGADGSRAPVSSPNRGTAFARPAHRRSEAADTLQ